jgi:hypothetical protein
MCKLFQKSFISHICLIKNLTHYFHFIQCVCAISVTPMIIKIARKCAKNQSINHISCLESIKNRLECFINDNHLLCYTRVKYKHSSLLLKSADCQQFKILKVFQNIVPSIKWRKILSFELKWKKYFINCKDLVWVCLSVYLSMFVPVSLSFCVCVCVCVGVWVWVWVCSGTWLEKVLRIRQCKQFTKTWLFLLNNSFGLD